MIEFDDTIAALSTSPGHAGLAVVRISGPASLEMAQSVFVTKRPGQWPPRRMMYGEVQDGDVSIGDGLAVYMPAPHSYTRQDVVEISVHGGRATAALLLELLADHGVRMAEPGEFTRRAFLSGRIDLSQAEAVMDVIAARSKAGLVAAQRQLAGALSGQIGQLRDRLMDARALLEVNIDFPEEEIGELDTNRIVDLLNSVRTDLSRLEQTYHAGRMVREGVSCVIVGRPNVGKSSLMNCLLDRRRAIVTETPGTTRDFLEDTATIGDLPFRLTDTAGLRETDDPIEGEGVRITRERIEQADLVLFMIDAAGGLTDEDRAIRDSLSDVPVLLPVINKIDLADRQTGETLATQLPGAAVISAKERIGIDKLQQSMVDALQLDRVPTASDQVVLTSARHRQLIVKGVERIDDALRGLAAELSPELVAVEVVEAGDALGEIIGETTPDDVLNHIFDSFCIGK